MTTVTDPAVIAEIRHELAFGTPNTPQRIATIKRADALYRRTQVHADFFPERIRTRAMEYVTGHLEDVLYQGQSGLFALCIDATIFAEYVDSDRDP